MESSPDDVLPTELRLSLDWELWVVEQLLFSGKRDDLIQVLARQGVEPALAKARVTEILRSGGFARMRDRLRGATLQAKLQRVDQQLRVERSLIVRPDIDRDSFLAEHWVASRPVLLTEAAQPMAAVQRWSLRALAERFGEVAVEVNVDRLAATRAAHTERGARQMPLGELIALADEGPSNDAYIVSRNGLMSNPCLAPLWDDLQPLPAVLELPQRPRGVSMWLGPAGTITPPHYDPHNVLLVQVQGRKRVRLGPRVDTRIQEHLDGFYLGGTLDGVFGERVITCELSRGQALFVPVGWVHEVTAVDPSITLSFLNFPWPNHFHWLGPAGSDDEARGGAPW